MSELECAIADAIEDSERSRGAAPAAGVAGVRRNREASSVYSVRLPDTVIDQLNALALALEQGVPASALVRGFVLDGLATHQGGDLLSALDRLERDVLEVRRKALPA